MAGRSERVEWCFAFLFVKLLWVFRRDLVEQSVCIMNLSPWGRGSTQQARVIEKTGRFPGSV